MRSPVVVLGCGGHGKVVADAARAAGFEVLGFADDSPARRGTTVAGLPVIAVGRAELSTLAARGVAVVLALGDNRVRARVFDELVAEGVTLATVVHPSAVVAPSVTLGRGTVLLAGAVVNPDAVLGDDVIVNTRASIDHDARIGAHVHLSPGVVLGGTVTIGEGTHLAVGVAVRNNVTVGAWSTVGVGAAVVGDLPDHVVAYGVPARVVRPAP